MYEDHAMGSSSRWISPMLVMRKPQIIWLWVYYLSIWILVTFQIFDCNFNTNMPLDAEQCKDAFVDKTMQLCHCGLNLIKPYCHQILKWSSYGDNNLRGSHMTAANRHLVSVKCIGMGDNDCNLGNWYWKNGQGSAGQGKKQHTLLKTIYRTQVSMIWKPYWTFYPMQIGKNINGLL